jgi:hypothetical protein
MDIPELKGMKHSSLDRAIELSRLALRDSERPDFRIYTGNDLGVNMIEYGSDYLLGLATFCPERFAERDPPVGNGRRGVLRTFRRAAALGQRGVPGAGSCVQAFGGSLSAPDGKNSI